MPKVATITARLVIIIATATAPQKRCRLPLTPLSPSRHQRPPPRPKSTAPASFYSLIMTVLRSGSIASGEGQLNLDMSPTATQATPSALINSFLIPTSPPNASRKQLKPMATTTTEATKYPPTTLIAQRPRFALLTP